MVVNWSHVVTATMAHKPEAKSRLGTRHKIVLSTFYGILVVCILVVITVYAATLVNTYAFIVIGVSGILYCFFVIFGFLFYGLKIYVSSSPSISNNLNFQKFTLRKTQDVAFSSLRITKFMLAVDSYFVIVMIVASWVVMGYILGWDNVGLFLGEYRNIELDLVFLILIALLSYMLYHSENFSNLFWGLTVGTIVKTMFCSFCSEEFLAKLCSVHWTDAEKGNTKQEELASNTVKNSNNPTSMVLPPPPLEGNTV